MLLILLPITVFNATTQTLADYSPPLGENTSFELAGTKGFTIYTPKFNALNFEGLMTLTPIFTPDNAHTVHAAWIARANSTIDIQNQYITQYDGDPWSTDSNPIVRGIVDAAVNRGVTVRVQVNEGSDSDDVTSYLSGISGITVRWMGTSRTDSGDGYLANTHNKLVIIDEKVILISSINFGESAFANNREAGMVIQSETAADYFKNIFESDWEDGEPPSLTTVQSTNNLDSQRTPPKVQQDYTSHTDIPDTNFTGTYNISLFANPDNADEVIFRYLESAQTSIYVSMYTISREDFTDTLVALKNANPALDIQVLISKRRVGASENVDTRAAAEELVANLIPVYNSTTDDDKVDLFYHNKYWLIDGKHTFVYSGNWSPRSVTPEDDDYTSGNANRDMGVAVHDAPDITAHFKSVWDADVAVGSEWELPIGIKQTGFSDADVVSGSVTIAGQIPGLEGATVSYRWNSGTFKTVTATGGSFSESFDTTTLSNGVNTLELKADTGNQTFYDEIKVNVVNVSPYENWRVLITELIPDPSDVSDVEGEFIELTNTYPFDIVLTSWQLGDDKDLYSFGKDYTISSYSSIIIARSTSGFQGAYGTTADFELDIALTNAGDYVQLLNAKGDYMDVVAFGSATAPDGSETVTKPGAGEALLRTRLHVDTDTAADFSLGIPDPKGTVPQEPLRTAALDTSSEVPIPWIAFLVAIIFISLVRRKGRIFR